MDTQTQQTFAYRGSPDASDPPRAAHGGDKAYRRGLHAGIGLAARLIADAETPAEAVLMLVKALNVASELRDTPEFVPNIADEISRRTRA